MAGSIVADLWQPCGTRRVWNRWPSDVWLDRGHIIFVVRPVVGFVVGPLEITGINALYLLTPPFPPLISGYTRLEAYHLDLYFP